MFMSWVVGYWGGLARADDVQPTITTAATGGTASTSSAITTANNNTTTKYRTTIQSVEGFAIVRLVELSCKQNKHRGQIA